jgi:hypothetical protein
LAVTNLIQCNLCEKLLYGEELGSFPGQMNLDVEVRWLTGAATRSH